MARLLKQDLTDILLQGTTAHIAWRGSFSWVIANTDSVLWTGKGAAREFPMDSHRAEGCGRLARAPPPCVDER